MTQVEFVSGETSLNHAGYSMFREELGKDWFGGAIPQNLIRPALRGVSDEGLRVLLGATKDVINRVSTTAVFSPLDASVVSHAEEVRTVVQAVSRKKVEQDPNQNGHQLLREMNLHRPKVCARIYAGRRRQNAKWY